MEKFVLASASPRRRELLALVVPAYDICTSQVEEEGITAPAPASLALALGSLKCKAVAALRPEAVVIGCDTVVELDGQPLGKPRNRQEARAMLGALSGRTHQVHTGVCVMAGGRAYTHIETTRVTFSPLSAEEIEAYIATDEPYDKAGGYGVQGGAARYVCRIEGCYFNVMGLPVSALYRLLRTEGLL